MQRRYDFENEMESKVNYMRKVWATGIISRAVRRWRKARLEHRKLDYSQGDQLL